MSISTEIPISNLENSDPYPSSILNREGSPVAWGAIIAGATAAAALSLILLILGTGLGLASVSPWVTQGISVKALGVSAILWITLTQVLASGLGGYLAGRLHSNWTTVNNDEVYFRDTAHGFLAWGLASLMTAAFLTFVTGAIVREGVQAGATIGSSAAISNAATANKEGTPGSASLSNNSGVADYFVDSLFRKNIGSSGELSATTDNNLNLGAANNAEVVRIFINTPQEGPLSAEDMRYVSQLVMQRTGVSETEAQQRVADAYNNFRTKLHNLEVEAKEAADKARKASAYTSLWLFVSLLIGAFVASLSAIYGGRHRRMLRA